MQNENEIENVPTFEQLCAQLANETQAAVRARGAGMARSAPWAFDAAIDTASAIGDLADFNYTPGDTTDIGGDTDSDCGVAASTRLVAACCATLAHITVNVAQGNRVMGYMGADTADGYAAWQADWFACYSPDNYAYRVNLLANAVPLLAASIDSGCSSNAVVAPQLALCYALRASLLPAKPGTLGDSAGILAELALEAVLGQY